MPKKFKTKKEKQKPATNELTNPLKVWEDEYKRLTPILNLPTEIPMPLPKNELTTKEKINYGK